MNLDSHAFTILKLPEHSFTLWTELQPHHVLDIIGTSSLKDKADGLGLTSSTDETICDVE